MSTVVILAAGLGSRFGGNKQLVEFGVKKLTLMEYNLLNAVKAGFNRVIFVIRPDIADVLHHQVLSRLPKELLYEVVLQTLDNLPENQSLSTERSKPLGTAHALWCCRKLLSENFTVINADDYYGIQAFKLLLEQSAKTPSDHLMVAYQLKNTLSEFGSVNRGLCQIDLEKNLANIEECENIVQRAELITGEVEQGKKAIELDENSLISMNCWLFNMDIFPLLTQEICNLIKYSNDSQAECYLPHVVMKQIAQEQKKVRVLQTTGQWFGLTYEQDCLLVNKKIDAILAEYRL
jgi:NDP-sugar pyrophosphorylase family protein